MNRTLVWKLVSGTKKLYLLMVIALLFVGSETIVFLEIDISCDSEEGTKK